MDIVHQGYKVAGMVGNMSAEIVENQGGNAYVEVILIDGDHAKSYDLNGLQTLIEDLRTVLNLAEQVESTNEPMRRDDS
jgi:hypothetical protein